MWQNDGYKLIKSMRQMLRSPIDKYSRVSYTIHQNQSIECLIKHEMATFVECQYPNKYTFNNYSVFVLHFIITTSFTICFSELKSYRKEYPILPLNRHLSQHKLVGHATGDLGLDHSVLKS